MKLIHSMRLKGPWDYLWLAPELTEAKLGCPLAGVVKIPVSWEKCFGEIPGTVRWSRRFQKPTNLEPTERVMIAAPGLAGVTAVRMNDIDLPMDDQPDTGFRFDVTDILEPSNQIRIEMKCETESETAALGMTEAVVIEIWSLIG